MDTRLLPVTTELARRLGHHRVLVEGAPFDDAIRIWNHGVGHRPAGVARCATPDDVSAAVTVAGAHGLPLSVRGGGHDWAGRSIRDGGLVVSLSDMRSVHVDPERRVAVVGGGATSADVIAATSPYGLVAATGTAGGVGMAGLTLGGGYGPLSGVHGLALDNLLAADVVLADGTQVRADPEHDADLLWALRGGGGNFGVVTSLHVRLHPLESILTGFVLFSWRQAGSVWAGLRELLAEAPDELTVQSGVFSGPDGSPVMLLSPAWAGEPETGRQWTARLEGLGDVLMSQVDVMPYATALTLVEAQMVDGSHYTIRTRTVADFTPEVVAALVEAGDTRTSPFSGTPIHHFHGAATRVAPDATAFANRDAHFVVEIVAGWRPDDADPERHVAWTDSVSAALAPVASPGGYVNLLGPDAGAQIDEAYGANASRLMELKRRYDPSGVFSATPLPEAVHR
ncbi:FAD-dependent oxidoreductase [Planotetraspora phitsanulokensis]|uniref:6-hydroxy-D-nicotine oxidase n=1 Tax=Planotetraspora phitsanulokensis TaxID=575192 RepID=A0A8J3XCZ2_9ACTN|nr:FAD-binding oxidoreductase [Planotetraspora phitsanulokensis]GII36697.1 6-hydroxy-D-nicotine oxidase [Planotetraspora phitsanulokensis]